MSVAEVELADRLARRRARIATVMGILLIATQSSFVIKDGPIRSVDLVHMVAWAVWIAVILVFILFGGGGLFRGATVRNLMNDEGSEQNRRGALVCGFWVTMAGAAVCYAASLYEPVGAREALHVVITIGVAGALLRFGALERRALAG